MTYLGESGQTPNSRVTELLLSSVAFEGHIPTALGLHLGAELL